MRSFLAFSLLLTAACSTVESRRDAPPQFEQFSEKPLTLIQGCIADRTSAQQVVYLPRSNGGSFSAGAGPQRYIYWVIDIDDLGDRRRVSIHGLNQKVVRKDAMPAVSSCL